MSSCLISVKHKYKTKKMSSIPEKIIIRNLRNNATEEEIRQLNEWLRQDKNNVALYGRLEELWASRKYPEPETIREGWAKLYEDLKKTPQIKPIPLVQNKNTSRTLWIRYAAALFIGILISSAIWWAAQPEKQQKQELLVQNIVHNKNGVQEILLPDHSEVFLNGDTRLIYPEKFTDNRRCVQLEGDAYFDIRKNVEKPFIIHTGSIEIEVTGTEFFIETCSADTTSIILISGSVNVSCESERGEKSTIGLLPGQRAMIDKINGSMATSLEDTLYYKAWKDGTYRFTDKPLEEISRLIAKRFNLDIQIASSLRTKRFTGRITSDDDIRSILSTIKTSYPIQYQISEETIRIYE